MKTVLIIGGMCDIGKYLANYYIDKGYKVVVGYNRNFDRYNEFVDYIKCDVTKYDDIDNIIKYTIDKYKNIDVLVNLACIYMDNCFLNKTKDEFMRVLEVNLVGTFLCSQIYSRYIDNGLIVNMSSTDGIDTGSQYSIDYSASKAGIISISKNMAMGTKNKILCICPNWIDTFSTREMDNDYLLSELKRIGQSRLITKKEFVSCYDKIVSNEFNSGDIFRIDIKGDKLWVEKM